MKKELELRSLSNTGKKFATKPSSGIYYALPNKDFSNWEIVYRRADEYTDPDRTLHYDMFPEVVRKLKEEFKLSSGEVVTIGDNYTGIPRGRILSPEETDSDKWTITHGDDVPSTIRHQVLSAFGLLGLTSVDKVKWEVVNHEKMDPTEKKIVLDMLRKKVKEKFKLSPL